MDLANLIDHTFLKAYGSKVEIRRLCDEARRWGFAAVMVHPCEVRKCRYLLLETEVKVGTVVGFPLGQNSTEVKLYEARDAIKRGAQEIDMVLNIRNLQERRMLRVKDELTGLAKICQEGDALSKLIIETCYLSEEEKVLACQLAVEAGIDFVKTSTGMGSAGATVEDVKLMVKTVAGKAGVKAAGGIRTRAQALALVEAGATRLGTSASTTIMKEE